MRKLCVYCVEVTGGDPKWFDHPFGWYQVVFGCNETLRMGMERSIERINRIRRLVLWLNSIDNDYVGAILCAVDLGELKWKMQKFSILQLLRIPQGWEKGTVEDWSTYLFHTNDGYFVLIMLKEICNYEEGILQPIQLGRNCTSEYIILIPRSCHVHLSFIPIFIPAILSPRFINRFTLFSLAKLCARLQFPLYRSRCR